MQIWCRTSVSKNAMICSSYIDAEHSYTETARQAYLRPGFTHTHISHPFSPGVNFLFLSTQGRWRLKLKHTSLTNAAPPTLFIDDTSHPLLLIKMTDYVPALWLNGQQQLYKGPESLQAKVGRGASCFILSGNHQHRPFLNHWKSYFKAALWCIFFFFFLFLS